MHLTEGGQGRARCKKGLNGLRRVLEDEATLGNVAHVVSMETDNGFIEVDGVKEGNGSAARDEGNGLVWFAAGQKDKEHGNKGGGALHAGVAMDENGVAGIVGTGDSVDGLK